MSARRRRLRVGLVSDTHGLLRPGALAFLAGCDHIVHGGDIGDGAILAALAAIAPVTAVRGNNDHGPWAERLPEVAELEAGGVRILVIHDLKALRRDPASDGIAVVVSGHSHQPRVLEVDGVLYVNPGSAGPRRFRLPVCAGELLVGDGRAEPRLVDLPGEGPTPPSRTPGRTRAAPRGPGRRPSRPARGR